MRWETVSPQPVSTPMPSPTFTAEDRAFLTAILNQPAELTGWLAYADWLDERDQPDRAEYLRLMAGLDRTGTGAPGAGEHADRLRELRAKIHPDWTAVFDRPAIENCGPRFAFKCPKRWENLKATGETHVRHCDECNQPVYYCTGVAEAQAHAGRGRCVAVSLGVDRVPGDLSPPPSGDEFDQTDVMGLIVPVPPLQEPDRARTHTVGRLVQRQPPPPVKKPWWKFW